MVPIEVAVVNPSVLLLSTVTVCSPPDTPLNRNPEKPAYKIVKLYNSIISLKAYNLQRGRYPICTYVLLQCFVLLLL